MSEFLLRNPAQQDPNSILQAWSFEHQAQHSWETHHLLIDQMYNQGTPTGWSHGSFLSLPQQHTQQKLQQQHSAALHLHLSSLMQPRDRIKLLSASGQGAAAFLNAIPNMPGCSLSNQEFELALKIRLNAQLHVAMPHSCICKEEIDPYGDHLFKCKRGNEWDTRHTAITVHGVHNQSS